jgi:gliding motility-associated lipoprotein GldH
MIKGTDKTAILIIIFLVTVATGCSRNTLYTDVTGIPSEEWSLDNVVEFKPEMTDTSSICNISFSIRTGASFPFRNIWLFINTVSPSGKSITDTLQYFLADEKGKWYGHGFGDIHELELPFRTGIYFPEKGTYTFKIRHGMRVETLKGVYDLGLRIEKIKK